ncbi:hypothetical protein K7957_09570 [Sphingomonas yunnanensis]|uniref:hypothetical protein n=1 Tax=Sphingomonas yunnanensis TaxID=310400 RepID=UPI001CA6F571|nr:hypothetical protein [Sphingomonas yunnanensis]MBY9063182.1 hypothetical protein [Sphingomonas yunnanensis]
MRRGRALRCWGLLLGLWVSARAAWLSHESLPRAGRPAIAASVVTARPAAASVPHPGTVATARVRPVPRATDPNDRSGEAAAPRHVASPGPARSPGLIVAAESAAPALPLPLTGSATVRGEAAEGQSVPLADVTGLPVAAGPAPRWSQTGWLLLRGGATTSTAAPQLGGAQLGVRIARALDDKGGLAASLRLVSALQAREREAIAAVEWHPRALPLRVLAERRIGVAGLRSGWGIGTAAGISDRALRPGALLDAYLQAGVIERRGGYADGAVSLEHPLTQRGGATLRLGVGAWGAAQRGAERLDVGPTASLRLGHARATLAWRARVAGDARPSSGAALTIAIDH